MTLHLVSLILPHYAIASLVCVFSFFLCLLLVSISIAQEKPALQLAQSYEADRLELSQYWVSEKLDGVRGYWDGKQLLTRSGRNIIAPSWFTAPFPKGMPLDGELWIARGKFDQVSGIIRSQTPDDAEWRHIKYCLFDLPKHGETFDQRVLAIRKLVSQTPAPWLQAVPQFKVQSEQELHAHLQKTVKAGGEGLMLHNGSAKYQTKRTRDLLKLKPHQDAEAKVIGHQAGKGKYSGMLGALLVQLPDGRQLKLGTGFSDHQRQNPPNLGATITYQYTGLTSTGLPRFPRFLRIREKQ